VPQAQTVALPKRLPLAVQPENRSSSTDKDAKLINGFLERIGEDSYQLYSRIGLGGSVQPSGGAATGRGVYNWLGDIYSIFGSTLYKNTTNIGTVGTSNGVYQFNQSSGATPRLVFGDGVNVLPSLDKGSAK